MINSIKLKEGYEPRHEFDFLRDYVRNKQVRNLYKRLEKGIEFKKGINVLVGENGCGKSTVLNIIKTANRIEHSFIPKMDYLPVTTFESLKNLFDCFEIKEDWRIPVFNLYRMCEDKDKLVTNDLSNIMEASQFISINEESKGQNLVGDMNTLFHVMFEKQSECFPTMHYLNKYKNMNFRNFNSDDVIKMIFENDIECDTNDVTIIMDEPDCGLDIKNLEEVYEIISKEKEQTQLIVSIHNPILLYKLSKLDYVNIIEMSDNYLNDMIKFVEG